MYVCGRWFLFSCGALRRSAFVRPLLDIIIRSLFLTIEDVDFRFVRAKCMFFLALISTCI